MTTLSKLLLLLTLPLLLLSASCSKDGGNIKAEGTVIDETTGQAVPEAMVYLRQSNRGLTTAGGLGGATIASQKADENGKFSFTFGASRDYIYEVLAVKDNYGNDGNNSASIPTNGSSDIKVPLQPVAYLKIHVVNANPFDKNDYISVDNTFLGVGSGPFIGKTIDTFAIGKVSGNKEVKVIWFVRKNGVTKNYSEKTYCPAFDTTLYEIKY